MGGLKMPDIYSIHTCQKLMWLKRLIDDNKRKWKVLSWSLLGIEKVFLDFKLTEGDYKVAKTKYYQQLLDCWFNIKARPPCGAEEILHKYLLYNRFIKLGGCSLNMAINK